jgi:hypothetical protein
MRHGEEPSPGPTSHRYCLCSSRSCWPDVSGRRVPGDPTNVARCDVRAAARSPDQGWGHLVLLVVVVDNPDKPASLGCLAGRPFAHRRVCSRPCWNRLCGRWLHSHRSLTGHSIISGPRWTVLIFFADGVLVTPSSIVCRWVHPSRMIHTRC